MELSKNCRLIMAGDSITDCSRERPVADNSKGKLGTGYVAVTDAMLTVLAPALNHRITNAGISGNTVRTLYERWQSDVLALNPDYVTVMIGVNDVWRQFDCPQIPEKHVYLEEYCETYERLILDTLPQVKGMWALSAFFLEPNRSDPMRAMLDRYNEAARQICQKHCVPFVDIQAAFDRQLQYRHPMYFAWDRVHPSQAGHTLVAIEFLRALGVCAL